MLSFCNYSCSNSQATYANLLASRYKDEIRGLLIAYKHTKYGIELIKIHKVILLLQ